MYKMSKINFSFLNVISVFTNVSIFTITALITIHLKLRYNIGAIDISFLLMLSMLVSVVISYINVKLISRLNNNKLFFIILGFINVLSSVLLFMDVPYFIFEIFFTLVRSIDITLLMFVSINNKHIAEGKFTRQNVYLFIFSLILPILVAYCTKYGNSIWIVYSLFQLVAIIFIYFFKEHEKSKYNIDLKIIKENWINDGWKYIAIAIPCALFIGVQTFNSNYLITHQNEPMLISINNAVINSAIILLIPFFSIVISKKNSGLFFIVAIIILLAKYLYLTFFDDNFTFIIISMGQNIALPILFVCASKYFIDSSYLFDNILLVIAGIMQYVSSIFVATNYHNFIYLVIILVSISLFTKIKEK